MQLVTVRRKVWTLDKLGHLLITLMLISSTAAIHLMDEDPAEKNTEGGLPGFEGIEIYEENKTVNLESMDLRQKIGLSIVSYEYEKTIPEDKIIGGIHLGAHSSKKAFKETVNNYSSGRPIEPLITVDLEGCIEPTSEFRDFQSFKQVNTSGQAYELAKRQGRFLSDIGADINFAPVVDLEDSIWGCRSFPGDYRTVAEKSCAYVEGLQEENVMATVKHYPGSTLKGKDPHNEMKKVTVSERDIFPFRSTMRCGVDAVMPSHQITNGTVDTEGVPADVSDVSRKNIREKHNFSGLIVSDAISMEGLTNFYNDTTKRYIDLFRNNDVILNLIGGRNDTVDMINRVEKAVKEGRLKKKFIDQSTKRLLLNKGWKVKTGEGNMTKVFRP